MRLLITVCLLALVAALSQAYALENIVRPYSSVRSTGMGGVFITTGLYDENIYGNPARVTANPAFRLVLIDPMFEFDTGLFATNVASANVQGLAGGTGGNTHVRQQLTPLSFYFPASETRSWAFSIVPLVESFQLDADLRRSYQASLPVLLDAGSAISFGTKLLRDNSLAVGATGHVAYRLATTPNYSMASLISGVSLTSLAGDGLGVDFDLGATYRLPIEFHDFELSVGASLNNVLGGGFNNLHLSLLNTPGGPTIPQPRSFGLGVSAIRKSWGIFTDTTFAIEAQDFGNNVALGNAANGTGSFFRQLHLGAETKLSVFVLRAGMNQGYLTAGAAFDFRFATLEASTYGEEMSLNTGGLEDRRFVLKLTFQAQGGKSKPQSEEAPAPKPAIVETKPAPAPSPAPAPQSKPAPKSAPARSSPSAESTPGTERVQPDRPFGDGKKLPPQGTSGVGMP